MFDHGKSEVCPKEVILILFKEYDTLRAEAQVRTSGGFQLITIAALAVTVLLGWASPRSDGAVWVALIGIFALAAAFIWYQRHASNLLAWRLRQIESEINRLAGAEILQWESKWSGAIRGRLKGIPR